MRACQLLNLVRRLRCVTLWGSSLRRVRVKVCVAGLSLGLGLHAMQPYSAQQAN